MLDKFAYAWARRLHAKWLGRWAWTSIIKGSRLGWRRFQSTSGTAFRNFAFQRWRDHHRKNMRKGGRILLALWRRNLRCSGRAVEVWKQQAWRRRRILRFYFLRCYRAAWRCFMDSVVYSRCTRRIGHVMSLRVATGCLRAAMRAWSLTAWRGRADFWRRHCSAVFSAMPLDNHLCSWLILDLAFISVSVAIGSRGAAASNATQQLYRVSAAF